MKGRPFSARPKNTRSGRKEILMRQSVSLFSVFALNVVALALVPSTGQGRSCR
jgi:hypothetical protein